MGGGDSEGATSSTARLEQCACGMWIPPTAQFCSACGQPRSAQRPTAVEGTAQGEPSGVATSREASRGEAREEEPKGYEIYQHYCDLRSGGLTDAEALRSFATSADLEPGAVRGALRTHARILLRGDLDPLQ